MTASFGVATFGEDASSKDELLKAVDEAMYQVKETSKDPIALAGVPTVQLLNDKGGYSPQCWIKQKGSLSII